MSNPAATRSWRLRGYTAKTKDTKPSYDRIHNGDQALDAALKVLESNRAIVRITASQA